MRIHHVTVPAQDPCRVARVLAELLGARAVPLPHSAGSYIVYAGDSDGTAIEVWPASLRAAPGDHELVPSALPLPESWPHHAYLTSDACDAKTILATFEREGWRAECVHNGPPGGGFSLVRGWIENQWTIELGGSQMRTQYEKFFAGAGRAAAGMPS
jgi:catechol 2,3-dioxygenase-like lactoylglutathione lyase family enzyme